MHLCLCIFMHAYIFMYTVVAKSDNDNGVRVGKVSMMDSSRKFGFLNLFDKIWFEQIYKYWCFLLLIIGWRPHHLVE